MTETLEKKPIDLSNINLDYGVNVDWSNGRNNGEVLPPAKRGMLTGDIREAVDELMFGVTNAVYGAKLKLFETLNQITAGNMDIDLNTEVENDPV
ncbi:MAG: hypothetical protein FWE01_00010 [Firmicutes bacterium]|nr:hypothetical protein [Bacillota bacterium]